MRIKTRNRYDWNSTQRADCVVRWQRGQQANMMSATPKIGDGRKVNCSLAGKSEIQENQADPAEGGNLLLCSLQQRDLAQK